MSLRRQGRLWCDGRQVELRACLEVGFRVRHNLAVVLVAPLALFQGHVDVMAHTTLAMPKLEFREDIEGPIFRCFTDSRMLGEGSVKLAVAQQAQHLNVCSVCSPLHHKRMTTSQ